MSRCWYVYVTGYGTQPQLNCSNYIIVPPGGFNCSGVNEICVIYAPDCGINPACPLSPNMQAYIISGLANSSITLYPGIGQPYIYKKD